MDIRPHYQEHGEGAPLILLHGNGEDGTYFAQQKELFARHFRTIILDTRGHGQTPRGTAPFTIKQFSCDLLAFMDQLGIERAHLLGFSDGGNIALTFALAHPQRVDRLVLNGANLHPRGMKRRAQVPLELEYRAASLRARRSDAARAKAELLGLMVHEPNIHPDELANLHVPTLVIAGTSDMIREDHTRLIAASLPNAQLALIPGDHFIAAKNPAAFNRVVEEFLLKL